MKTSKLGSAELRSIIDMAESIRIGDRIKVFLDSKFWKSEGWFEGTVVRIDPYSKHRQFYWVELDVEVCSSDLILFSQYFTIIILQIFLLRLQDNL